MKKPAEIGADHERLFEQAARARGYKRLAIPPPGELKAFDYLVYGGSRWISVQVKTADLHRQSSDGAKRSSTLHLSHGRNRRGRAGLRYYREEGI